MPIILHPQDNAAAARIAGGGSTEAAAAAPSAAPTSNAAAIFEALGKRLAEKPELAGEVDALVGVRISEPDSDWTINMTSDGTGVSKGKAGKAVATLHLSDADLTALVKGEAAAQDLYQRGNLRVDGDVTVAHRLGFLKGLI